MLYPTVSRSFVVLAATFFPAAAFSLSCGGPPPEASASVGEMADDLSGVRGAASSVSAGPHLVFEAREHDFGTVRDTGSLDWSFDFRNDGSEPLKIKKVKASCGCTATELDRLEFAPGESDSIRISWEPKGFGPQVKTIDVLSNSAGESLVRLTIRAEIEPFVRIEPAVANFGDVLAGSAATVQLGLSCEDPDFEVLNIDSGNPLLDVSVVRGVDVGSPEFRSVLMLRLSADTKPGGFIGNVKLDLRGRPEGAAEPVTHSKKISVRASVHGQVVPDRDGFYVGRVAPSGDVSFTVRLRHREGRAFGVETSLVGMPLEGLSVRVVPGDEGGTPIYDLILEGPVGSHTGRLYGSVVAKTDVPGEAPLRFPIMGIVGPPTK